MKKIICIILTVSFVFTLTSPAFAENENSKGEIIINLDKEGFVTDYPYIFVHGMGGWGYGSKFYEQSPYWGGGLMPDNSVDLIKLLNEQGVEAYAPAVGPLSSAWDRACELYAQLTGTVVDYGEAHSKAHDHDRYGYSYEGKAVMGEPWNIYDKLNLVGHSFGGATVRLFTSLLAYGNKDEINATGRGTSPLFTGGHNSIHSCVTLSAPHNGSQVANMVYDTKPLFYLISFAVNFAGMIFGDEFLVFSFQLGHFGLTPKQDETRAKLNLTAVKNFFKAEDNCGYDLTLRGAAKLNEQIKLVDSTYYYSYSTVATEYDENCETEKAINTLNPIFNISCGMIAMSKGRTVDGVKMEGEWLVNDGIVPLISSKYPLNDEKSAVSIEKAEAIKPGRWNYFEPMVGMDHLDFCGRDDYPTDFGTFYGEMINTVNAR